MNENNIYIIHHYFKRLPLFSGFFFGFLLVFIYLHLVCFLRGWISSLFFVFFGVCMFVLLLSTKYLVNNLNETIIK